MQMSQDPLVILLRTLNGTKPDEEWIAEWSRGGKDPLVAAWEASSDPNAMLEVLELCGRVEYGEVTKRPHAKGFAKGQRPVQESQEDRRWTYRLHLELPNGVLVKASVSQAWDYWNSPKLASKLRAGVSPPPRLDELLRGLQESTPDSTDGIG